MKPRKVEPYDAMLLFDQAAELLAKAAYVAFNQPVTVGGIMQHLTRVEAWVLVLRAGLGGYEKCSLQKIADIRGVTRERIRQIESKAVRRMKAYLAECQQCANN
jgi:DNA-directed RNA polymerase sigma subunit (sigma70/sigma32)